MKNIKKHFVILSIIFVLILIWGILLKMNQLHIIERDFSIMSKKSIYERFIDVSFNPFKIGSAKNTRITFITNVIVKYNQI